MQQLFRQFRRFQNRFHQHQAAARILVLGQVEQRAAHRRIAPETLRALNQPEIERIFRGAHVRHQFVVEAFRIVHQISGMNVEEFCQQQARLVGKVRTRAILNLREIALADLQLRVRE